jgi:crotonobetaine/carnitine-CoA ligase
MSPHQLFPRDTVVHALARAVDACPDRVFVDVAGDRRTYGQIDKESNRLAHEFALLGIGHGDTVATIFDTSVDVLTTWFAINKLGAIWVPINTAYRGEFLKHQLSDAGARLILCDDHYLQRIVEIADQLPLLQRVLVRKLSQRPDCPVEISDLDVHRGQDETPLPIVVKPEHLGMLIYSSGTTGASKGCMLSHNYICMQGYHDVRMVPHGPDDVCWTCLPLFHLAALCLVLGALVNGLRCAIAPRFSVTSFWSDIEASGANHALLMAGIFSLVAHAPEDEAMKRCHGKLKMIWGQPMTPEIRKIWQERFGVEIVYSYAYGQTECNRISFCEPGDIPPERSCGRPAAEYELMIFGSDDQPLPDGEIGEIVVRPRAPNTMFEGYWNQPEQTTRVWRNLWMHTGDLGKLENGYLFFMDRAKDYLRSRGENISSFELERTFMAHPDIMEVAVHAVGQQDAEDEVKATIVLRAGAGTTERDLCLWAIEKLPYFAVPRYLEFRSELVKNPTGKVLKYRLREQGVTPATWDREVAGIAVRKRSAQA